MLRLAFLQPDPTWRSALSPRQRDVLDRMAACRTAHLGGHVEVCDGCGHVRFVYHACGDRHCSACHARGRSDWLAARESELLPVPYFHVVFTLPAGLRPVALQNPRVVYGALFRAAAATLMEVAANPEHLGARIGVLAVLHTWGQNLSHHPHVHCLVTGGGLSPDGTRWVACRGAQQAQRPEAQDRDAPRLFFLPVRILSRVFRGKFLAALHAARRRGELSFHGALASLAHDTAWNDLLNQSVRKPWVVYAKRPWGGPEIMLRYLARYTHRVAISDQRILAANGQQVTFDVKDYRRNGQHGTVTLSLPEFTRRLAMHILPKGFTRMRTYGLWANRDRQATREHCRQLLAQQGSPNVAVPVPETQCEPSLDDLSAPRCAYCGGPLRSVRLLAASLRWRMYTARQAARVPIDSS